MPQIEIQNALLAIGLSVGKFDGAHGRGVAITKKAAVERPEFVGLVVQVVVEQGTRYPEGNEMLLPGLKAQRKVGA